MAQAPMALAGGAACLAGAYFVYDQYFKAAPQQTQVASLKNRAFVFVKPHAATDETAALVRDAIKKKGFTINKEGDITSAEIDEKKLIDQHYYAIASKATIQKPEQMNVPADKFEQAFGQPWDKVLKENKAFNALDACKELKIDAEKMNKLWAEAKKNNKLVKLGGGFYCGQINANGKSLYVFNGFFMEMRNAFTAPGKKIHYYDVEWDPRVMTWSDFRNKFLGPTDPKDAPPDSLRGTVLRNWKNLGLKAEPNIGDNAVHASASPFEGLAERMNWMGMQCKQDDYCRALLNAGIPENLIKEWTRDPQVVISADKKKKSLFDSLEDKDAKDCLESAKALAKFA